MQLQNRSVLIIALAFAIGLGSGLLLRTREGGGTLLNLVGLQPGSQAEIPGSDSLVIPEAHQGRLQLFILAGQSNMSGRGTVPASGAEVNSRIYLFGNDYRWKLAREPVDDSANQVDPVSEDRPVGVSPGMTFARTLLEQDPGRVIGLIPCARGDSAIHEWQRNWSDTTLYGSCLKRVRAASGMGRVAGFLFFQGEVDAIAPTARPNRILLPDQWATQFTTMVQDWRRDLNSPRLPVVFAQIGSNTEPEIFKNWATVQAQQRQVRLPLTAMITTEDLALRRPATRRSASGLPRPIYAWSLNLDRQMRLGNPTQAHKLIKRMS
mgnify:CR=1 FL=1